MGLKVENKPMISLTRGRVKTFTATVTDQAGALANITGATVLFTVKTDYGANGAQVFTKTLTGVEAGASFATGVVAISVLAADTSGFTIPPGEEFIDLIWDLKVTLAGLAIGTTFDGSRTGKLRLFQALG